MSAPQGDDLERRLTELFQQRAATVTQARGVDLDSGEGDRKAASARPRRFGTSGENLVLLAAAVVVLVALAGTVLGIQAGLSGQGRDSGTGRGGPMGSASGSYASSAGGSSNRCEIAAPPSWRQAIAAGAVPVDRTLNDVLSVNGSTGDYLVLQGNEPPSQTSALYSDIEVALFRGSRGVTIYTPEGSDIPHADPTGAISADWVTFALARPQNLNYSYKVMLYDRGAGVTRTLAEMPQQQGSQGKNVLGAPVIAAGKVHWLSTVHNKPETTTLESWDLARNSADGSVPAAGAVGLVSYGRGVAFIRTAISQEPNSDPTSTLHTGAGAPLTAFQLQNAAGGSDFAFDGVKTLSWLRFGANPAFVTTEVVGSDALSLHTDRFDGRSAGLDQPVGATRPFVAVRLGGSDALLDLRGEAAAAVTLPAGHVVQAVVGGHVVFGTGATKSGASGLSIVALSDLPPVSC